MNIPACDILPILGFFMITIGNGKFINSQFGNLVEYAGIIMLMLACIWPGSKIKISRIRKFLKVIVLSVLLSIGSFFQDTQTSTRLMIAGTSLILTCFATVSDHLISSNVRIKMTADAILCGAVFTTVIGLLTGTVGLEFNSKDAIIGVLFRGGFDVKNYCGGLWFLLLVLYYIYYSREGRIRMVILPACALIVLQVLSGSKAAILLSVLFLALANYNRFFPFKQNQQKLIRFVLCVIAFVAGIYIYNNLLSGVSTYAYRMRGLSKLLDHMSADTSRLYFGFSEIAYANNGKNYTTNMRDFLGWEASVEMAYVNILIKSGMVGIIAWICIYRAFLKQVATLHRRDQELAYAIIGIMLISGLVETYIVSIHYVVGPVLYCLLNGLINQSQHKT